MATVETSARLHFGFQNLSLAPERLYGGIGVSVDAPKIVIEAERAETVQCDDSEVTPYVEDAVEVLDVSGADVQVTERFRRHAGLGSGTQLALAAVVAIARAYGHTADARALAPELGRGGRSGVGVATFEQGGFVVDVGHPTERFTTVPPGTGSWQVPEPIGRWAVPDSWRFLLVQPTGHQGRSGAQEDQSIRSVVEGADAEIADQIATLLTRRLLPAVVEGNLTEFGAAVSRLGRLNGAWFADEQGGVYRPPAGPMIETLSTSDAIVGAGQSSWGPTVYGVTTERNADLAREAGERALAAADVEGDVRLVAHSDEGAVVRD